MPYIRGVHLDEASMGTVQDQVDKWLRELPRQLGAELIDKKLRAQKITLSKKRA